VVGCGAFAKGKGAQQVPIRLRSGQALHYATPDFLLRLVALASFMRLSLPKAAHLDVGEDCVAGNAGSLRFHGRPGQAGDKFVEVANLGMFGCGRDGHNSDYPHYEFTETCQRKNVNSERSFS
jgi:hypothetical protein